MKLRRMMGVLFMIAATAGFFLSVLGLVGIWHYRPAVTQTVTDTLTLIDQTLTTTQDGLNIVEQVVQTIQVDVGSLRTTTQALAQALRDTTPTLDSLAGLTDKEFPKTVVATQTSLASAQSSALLIDNMLATLSSIPFLPIVPYQPEVPLHTALAQVSTSLNSLIPALATIHTSLTAGKTSLVVIEKELSKINATTVEMSSALGSAQKVIGEYQAVTSQLKDRLEAAQRAVSDWLMTIAWVLSFVLGWLLFAQLGLFTQGYYMLQERSQAKLVQE